MHISHKFDREGGRPEVLILGCGNLLFGDDGFGPAVVESLTSRGLPPWVRAIDAGGGVRELLFDLLLLPPTRPAMLVLIDAAHEKGEAPGVVRERDPVDMEAVKMHDYSLHQFPTVNLLRELAEETGMRIRLVTAQAEAIPDRPRMGLSPVMAAAVEAACALVLRTLGLPVAGEAATP